MPSNAQTQFEMPKFDFNTIFAMQKANLDTFVEAQNIVVDAMQSIARLQYDWVEEAWKTTEHMFKGDVAKNKPEDFVAGYKSTAEKAFAVAKEQADLGLKAQKQVADLYVRRFNANVEQGKQEIERNTKAAERNAKSMAA